MPKLAREIRRSFDRQRRHNEQMRVFRLLKTIERASWELNLRVTPFNPAWKSMDYAVVVDMLEEVLVTLDATRAAAAGALR